MNYKNCIAGALDLGTLSKMTEYILCYFGFLLDCFQFGA